METFSYLGWIGNYETDFEFYIAGKIKKMDAAGYDVISITQNFIKYQGGQISTIIIFKKR